MELHQDAPRDPPTHEIDQSIIHDTEQWIDENPPTVHAEFEPVELAPFRLVSNRRATAATGSRPVFTRYVVGFMLDLDV